jgi:hypothetical protein
MFRLAEADVARIHGHAVSGSELARLESLGERVLQLLLYRPLEGAGARASSLRKIHRFYSESRAPEKWGKLNEQ